MSDYQEPVLKGKTNTLAIISLVTGILSVLSMLFGFCIPCGLRFIGFILGGAAAIMGFLAKTRIDQSMGGETGRGLALGGLISGAISAVICLILMILGIIGIGAMFSTPFFLEGLEQYY